LNRHEFIDWYEDVRVGTRRLISIVPDEAFEFQANKCGPTIEQIIRTFASMEDQYIRGVVLGDWSDSRNADDMRRQVREAFAEEAGDAQYFEQVDELETSDDVLDNLDEVHQNSLDILAELTEDEFQKRVVELPWGERGPISRLLLGLVEREIHHRTELYFALQAFGININTQILWGP
jgi:hypothetical protein